MAFIMILTFHVGILAILLFLFSYMLDPMLTTNLLFNLSVYSGTTALISLSIFIPLFLLNELYTEFGFTVKLNRNLIDDAANVFSILTLLFIGHSVYKFGFHSDHLFDQIYDYLTGLITGLF